MSSAAVTIIVELWLNVNTKLYRGEVLMIMNRLCYRILSGPRDPNPGRMGALRGNSADDFRLPQLGRGVYEGT
jgi:hypothetical protein